MKKINPHWLRGEEEAVLSRALAHPDMTFSCEEVLKLLATLAELRDQNDLGTSAVIEGL